MANLRNFVETRRSESENAKKAQEQTKLLQEPMTVTKLTKKKDYNIYIYGRLAVGCLSQEDHDEAMKVLYQNLSEESIASLKAGQALSDADLMSAMTNYYKKTTLAKDIRDNDVNAVQDVVVDGRRYVLLKEKAVVDMDGEVVCEYDPKLAKEEAGQKLLEETIRKYVADKIDEDEYGDEYDDEDEEELM